MLILTLLAVAQTAAAQPVGQLRLERHESTTGLSIKRCNGVLIAPDTVLTQAACFDALRRADGTLSLSDFDLSFATAAVPEPSWASAIEVHPRYQPLRCTDAPLPEACSQAEAYCRRHFVGISRNVCLLDRAYYAQSFLPGPRFNLAVVFLSRQRPDDEVACLASDAKETLQRGDALGLAGWQETPTTPVAALRFDDLSFVVPFSATIRQYPAAMAATGELIGFGSHITSLPFNAPEPLDYTFTRLDSVAAWLDETLQEAFVAGRRVTATPMARRLPGLGDPAPAPEPPMEGGERPGPQPVPPREEPPRAEPQPMPPAEGQPGAEPQPTPPTESAPGSPPPEAESPLPGEQRPDPSPPPNDGQEQPAVPDGREPSQGSPPANAPAEAGDQGPLREAPAVDDNGAPLLADPRGPAEPPHRHTETVGDQAPAKSSPKTSCQHADGQVLAALLLPWLGRRGRKRQRRGPSTAV